MRELKMLKGQCSDLLEQREKLLKDRVRLKEDNKELRKAVSDFQDQVGDMYTKMMNLIKADETLEKEYIKLKNQGPPMTEATK